MRVALQPARLEGAVRQHYEDTIASPVPFNSHVDLLSAADLARLRELFPDGSAQMWGVTPGVDDRNVGQVVRLQPGDFVMFYGYGRLYLAATIAWRFHNEPLAERLWQRDGKGQTWEYMYALTGTRSVEIPIEEVRPVLGWTSGIVQGFRVWEGAEAEGLAELANLDPSDYALPTAPAGSDVADAVNRFSGPLDRTRNAAYRAEQRLLKRRLRQLGGRSCALCGEQLPPQFLVAAHIKRRTECSDTEKLDLDNVAMLACLLGCDSLYEHGYITVDPGGKIAISSEVTLSPSVARHCDDHLLGRTTEWWTQDREKYFAWHRTHTFRATI
ncbi:hypothetical protein RB614_20260 [Phytohabitans sp. ZYX-F-186]|uniref:HNH nuclease domain-containing protein n=1 Tax=Phytohabitans maris TaxID=3071409 RepID=A0ABU0ZIJ6_9ACTN|nr:hypothetical protein [Phytohabitans sp. ZYX-F-186]MDQ7906852.1 hypothetical protein [Phytohabitans sp. ZYX-F-186]